MLDFLEWIKVGLNVQREVVIWGAREHKWSSYSIPTLYELWKKSFWSKKLIEIRDVEMEIKKTTIIVKRKTT